MNIQARTHIIEHMHIIQLDFLDDTCHELTTLNIQEHLSFFYAYELDIRNYYTRKTRVECYFASKPIPKTDRFQRGMQRQTSNFIQHNLSSYSKRLPKTTAINVVIRANRAPHNKVN